MKSLKECKVGEFMLRIDLLGIAIRMADTGPQWVDALLDIQQSILESLDWTLDKLKQQNNINLFQNGDSLLFPGDDIENLTILGAILLTRLFDKDILAQAGIAGGGCFFLNDLSGLTGKGIKLHHSANLQMLVGPAVSRSYLILKGVKGLRFRVDEETTNLPSDGSGWWKKYAKREVKWWCNISEIQQEVEMKLKDVQDRINSNRLESQKSATPERLARDLKSLEKRKEHLDIFLKMTMKNQGT